MVVKAYYDGGIVETVTNYTLSGTLEVGTSTITVTYKGKTDSFDVTVDSSITYLYKWDFTQSLTDEIQGLEAVLNQGLTRDSGGLQFTAAKQCVTLINDLTMGGKTVEIDVANFDWQGNDSYHIRFMCNYKQGSTQYTGAIAYRAGSSYNYWGIYSYNANATSESSNKRWDTWGITKKTLLVEKRLR